MKFKYATGSQPLDGYTIKRGVGIGGFGDVYFAVSDAGKEVALKCIQRHLEVEVRGVTQCLNLKHTNLIDLYDLKLDDEGQAWVVMEYVAGESLKDVIDRNPNGMPTAEVDRWFAGMAAGVSYLHERGLVHRDLKPGNVFDDNGVVKIGDYGLSKLIEASRRSGQTETVGTFLYMAPEIGKGVYGKAIDLYALGVILFEMLTGRVPFSGESNQEIIMRHLTDDPDVSRIPEPYRSVIQRALRKDPEKRFATVPEMVAELEAGRKRIQEATRAMESRAGRGEPIYIGESSQATPPSAEIVFGPVRHHEVVTAEVVMRPRPPAPPVTVLDRGPQTPNDGAPASPRSALLRSATQRGSLRSPATGHWAGPVRTALLVALVLVLFHWPVLIPAAVLGGGVYLLVRAIHGWSGGGRRRGAHVSPAAPAGAARSPHATEQWTLAAREALRKKPFGERIGELAGSMLVAPLVSAALGLAFLWFRGDLPDGGIQGLIRSTWLIACSVLGTWLLLAVSKPWEGAPDDGMRRHYALAGAGVLFAALAVGLAHFLFVQLPDAPFPGRRPFQLENYLGPDGGQGLLAYVLYFVLVFGGCRWWKQTDPLRKTRLSLRDTAVCLLWAWVLQWLIYTPQPWGFMMVAAISVSAQVAAPWVPRSERKQVV